MAGHPVLAAAPDRDVAAWAVEEHRRVVTENVRDVVPLLSVRPALRVLLTSSRRFPRSRSAVGPILGALRNWLTADIDHASLEWLP